MRKRFNRLMVVYLFLSMLAIFVKLSLPDFVNRPVLFSTILQDVLLFPSHNPLVTLWFIYVLFLIQVFFLTFHYFVRIRYDSPVHVISMIIFVSALGYFCRYLDVNVFGIRNVTYYSIFVLLGFIVRHYYRHVYAFIDAHKYWLLGVLTVGFYLLFGSEGYFAEVFVAISGIFLVLVSCIIVRSKLPICLGLLTLMGNYAYAIYLYSSFFELGGRVILAHYLMLSSVVVFCLDIVLGLFSPVLLSRFVLQRNRVLRGLSLGEW